MIEFDEYKDEYLALSKDQLRWFDNAVQLCLNKDTPTTEGTLKSIHKDIFILISFGKTLLNSPPLSKENIQKDIKSLKTSAQNLKKRLESLSNNTCYILHRNNALSINDINNAPQNAEEAEKQIAKELELVSNLERLLVGIEASLNFVKNEMSKNQLMNKGFSGQDEFAGICLNIFKKYRPNSASQSETGDFHKFTIELISISTNTYRESDIIGSLRKILKPK